MPTLEERLEALERALSILRTEHISDIKQLDERINALQQQIAEQRRRLAEHEQGMGQLINEKFETLMQVMHNGATKQDLTPIISLGIETKKVLHVAGEG